LVLRRVVSIVLVSGLAGCAPSDAAHPYASNAVQQAAKGEEGVVVGVRAVAVSAAGAVEFFRRYFGPTQMAFGRLDEAGQAKFAAALEELWAGANVAEDPEERTLVRNEYLEVVARRRAA